MFIAILTYRKPLSEVDKFLTAHREYLAKHYAAGDFIASGPLDEKTVCDPGFMDMLAPAVAQAARFNRFMNFTIEDFI